MTKRAFTLVELLVVTGIIASMATIGIGSYGAIKRGMANRGALAAATSIISLAQNRARIDMSPTVIYFMNELIEGADESADTQRRSAGMAIAIRRAGRVTCYRNPFLFDEYTGLENVYPSVETGTANSSDKDAGFRLYRFSFNNKPDYSIAKSVVVPKRIDSHFDDNWCDARPQKTKDVDTDDNVDDGDLFVYTFELKDANGVSWGIGDAYAYEFARIRLPDNYIFGSPGDEPSESTPVKNVKMMKFYPDADAGKSLETISVSALGRDGQFKSIGNTENNLKGI